MKKYLNFASFELKDQHVLVTGASSGIGLATAIQLAQKGCHLNVVARRKERLIELKDFCESEFKTNVNWVVGDLNSENTIQEMGEKRFFDSSILINSAGAAFGRSEVADLNLEDMKATLDINVNAAFRMIREIVPSMLAKGQGDIVSIGSIAGLEPYSGGATYCASKAALTAFHHSLRKEVYGKNLRVMLISPGMVETEFALVRWKQDESKASATYKGMTPLTAQDVAHQIVHMLCNPRHAVIDDLVLLATDQGAADLVRRRT